MCALPEHSRSSVTPLLALIAVITIAVNLRPGSTSPGPLLDDIVGHYQPGSFAVGVLAALPTVVFGLCGAVAVPLARRYGLTGTTMAGFVIAGVGLLLRPNAPAFPLFIALSVLALIGPAIANVLVPAWIKTHGGARISLLTAMYSAMLSAGAALGPALAIPLRADGSGGWAESLRFWGVIAVIPVAIWLLALTRTGYDYPRQPRGEVPARAVLRSSTAVMMTIMFGLQSMNAYVQFAFIPTILTDAGVQAQQAGFALALIPTLGVIGGLIMPRLVERSQVFPWIAATLGLLTAAGYAGVLWAPAAAPFFWATVLGIGGFCFPAVIALIPGRTRHPSVTAAVSGAVQPLGYLIAGAGSLLAGVVFQNSDSVTPLLVGLMLSGLVLGAAGWFAARGHMVDDQLEQRAHPMQGG